MTILRRILGSLLVILLLVGCQRDTITLPAPQPPNGEWLALYGAATAAVKTDYPDAVLLRINGIVDLTPKDPTQRLMFEYVAPDFTSLSILITQEKGVIKTTEIFSDTFNVALENKKRSLLDSESPFPTTPEEMTDYQRRTTKIRISPHDAIIRVFAEEQVLNPNQCEKLSVFLDFKQGFDAPIWFITGSCKPAIIILYDVNSETGAIISRKKVK